MPYRSEKQRRYMHAKHPDIAKRWDTEAKKKGTPSVQPKKKGSGGRGTRRSS
jgi:hypothetical protein